MLKAQNPRRNRVITIAEAPDNPGVYDDGAAALLHIDINTDGNGDDILQRWNEHQPDGFRSLLGAALVGEEGQVEGQHLPHYGTLLTTMKRIDRRVESSLLADGRLQHRLVLPELEPHAPELFSAYVGTSQSAVEYLYGKLQNVSFEFSRSGVIGGDMMLHFNRVRRAQAMPGVAPRNTVLRLVADGVMGDDGVFVLRDTPLGVGGELTIVPAETAVSLKAKLNAIPGYNAVGLTVGGAGFVTNAGQTSGELVLTFAGTLAATPIADFIRVEGEGWSAQTTTSGRDGTGPAIPRGPYIEPTHMLIYKATDKADLDSIDMGDADTPAPLDDPHLIRSARAHRVAFENLTTPVWVEDRSLNAAAHGEGDVEITDSVTLLKDDDGQCEDIYATENREGCNALGFYLRHAARCGSREFWIDFYGVRNAQPGRPVEDNAAMREFPRKRAYIPEGSIILTLIEPAT